MIGFAVAIRRKDGSTFFVVPSEGFATPVWFRRSRALARAKECRKHKMDAIVVKVEYHDPVIVGPKRFVIDVSGGEHAD